MERLVYLEFIGPEVKYYWRFYLTPQQIKAFTNEINIYNNWIQILVSGLAPYESYGNFDPDKLILAQNENYSGVFQKPQEEIYQKYKDAKIKFTLCDVKNPEEDQELIKYFIKNTWRNFEFIFTLEHIITNSWNLDQFYMGYRLLPLTRNLILSYSEPTHYEFQ